MSAPDPTEKAAFTLAEVSELTGITLRRLKEGCWAKEIPHAKFHGQRVMTLEQIARFLAANEVAPAASELPADVARIEEHRERVARRLARKAGRAA